MQQTEIIRILEQGFPRLTFPAELEGAFRETHQRASFRWLRRSVVYTFVLYLISGAGAYFAVDEARSGVWPMVYAAVGMLIILTLLITHRAEFEDRSQHILAGLAFLGLVLAGGVPQLVDEPLMQQVASYAAMLCYIAVYGMGLLRFSLTTLAAWGSGLAIWLLSLFTEVRIDWVGFSLYFLGANVLGTAICFLLEYRERTSFLQHQLLELEKKQLDEMSQEMARVSREDALTHLANRRYFNEVLEREWRRALRETTPLTIAFIDVDHFKAYNDAYGHGQGDVALIQIAEAIASQARRASDLAARYGGEEFIVLYPGVGEAEGVAERAEHILEAVRELAIPHESSPVASIVTVSAGMATCVPSHEGTYELLIQAADKALYAAKNGGRNTWRRGRFPSEIAHKSSASGDRTD